MPQGELKKRNNSKNTQKNNKKKKQNAKRTNGIKYIYFNSLFLHLLIFK